MHRILITHAFGPQNRGDHELLANLIAILRSKYPDSVYTVFTTFPTESMPHFPDVRFFKSPFYRPCGFKDWFYTLWDVPIWVLSSYFGWLQIFLSKGRYELAQVQLKQEAIFMSAGGYMYSNGFSFYANILNGLMFRQSNAQIIAAPMSIGPFYSALDRLLAKYFFKNIVRVHVRESYSYQLAETWGLKPTYTHDLAWWNQESIESEDMTWRHRFVGTVIDWNYPDHLNVQEMRDRYVNEYLKAIAFLFKYSGNQVVLYNQVGGGEGKSADEQLIAEIVSKSCGQAFFDNSALTPRVLKSRLCNCEGVIASRFHSALFAIQAEVPFVSLSYQPKAEFILKDLGLSSHLRYVSNFDGEEVADALVGFSAQRSQLKDSLTLIKKQARLNIEQSFLSLI